MVYRDVNRKPDFWFSVRKPKTGSISLATAVHFFSISSRQLRKNYQMSDRINSHICLLLSVYKSYHQTGKYGRQNFTGLET